MTRTRSDIFDDDVLDTFFEHSWSTPSILRFAQMWKAGRATRDVTRRAILQAFASRAVMAKSAGGWTQDEIKSMVLILQHGYPDLWKDTPNGK